MKNLQKKKCPKDRHSGYTKLLKQRSQSTHSTYLDPIERSETESIVPSWINGFVVYISLSSNLFFSTSEL